MEHLSRGSFVRTRGDDEVGWPHASLVDGAWVHEAYVMGPT